MLARSMAWAIGHRYATDEGPDVLTNHNLEMKRELAMQLERARDTFEWSIRGVMIMMQSITY